MPVNTRGNKDNSKVPGTRNKGKKPKEPTTSTSQSREEDSATEDSEQESEQESETSSSASEAQESEPSSSANTIQEVESLNTLFTLLDVRRSWKTGMNHITQTEPSKEDLIKTLQYQEKLLQNRTQCPSTLLIRFRSSKWRLDKIQLEESVKDDALTKLRNLKDKTLQSTNCLDSPHPNRLRKNLMNTRTQSSGANPSRSTPPSTRSSTRTTSQSTRKLEVDYSKIKKRIFKGAPMLDLDVSKFPIEDMIRELATRVIN
ncbi:hypothetical protein B0O80DRAFT_502976 [Mortierella sp. GBAus27b]|nr:hypothetical protein B0O80DRAFT_502976 [Mortierella sp. GBAus27b]